MFFRAHPLFVAHFALIALALKKCLLYFCDAHKSANRKIHFGKKTLQIPVTDSVIFIGISQNDKIIAGFQWLIGSISAYIGAYE